MEDDLRRSLLPLTTPLAYAKEGHTDLKDFVANHIFPPASPDGFLKATPESVLKNPLHSRRVLALDVVSAFYLYDFAWRNRRKFTVPRRQSDRRAFGPGFLSTNLHPINAFDDYQRFRKARYKTKSRL
jgi:hypothetical protein